MFKTFASGKPRNFQVEVVVSEKNVQVNINDQTANAWLPLSEDNQSSVNVTVNLETGKQSTNLSNVESIEAVSTVVTELIDAIHAVIAEFKPILFV